MGLSIGAVVLIWLMVHISRTMDLRELLPAETLAKWDTVEQDGAVIALRPA